MSISDIILSIATALTTAATAWLAVNRANQLTAFRIERLEKKVDQHNNFDRRVAVLEEAIKHLGGGRK
jgi:primosomal protein N''